jgi:hypothetical protein
VPNSVRRLARYLHQQGVGLRRLAKCADILADNTEPNNLRSHHRDDPRADHAAWCAAPPLRRPVVGPLRPVAAAVVVSVWRV